jgi:predicted ATP-dependent endonuclease of OLD family
MQKALLILTDLLTLPDKSIYLIDEYENSLGVTPINVLPNLLLSETINIQIFVTSHHPYIISKFPVENWYVAHRKGAIVSFASGKELAQRYSTSSQEKYIQLINDPFYSEGIE